MKGLSIPKTVEVALDTINFASYNPRTMPAARMKALKASLIKNGLVLNLVIQKKGMVCIGGHQRMKAIRELCAEHGWSVPTKVPAVVLDIDDAKARQLNVSLNAPGLSGDFEPYRLGEMFVDILPMMTQDDVLATGFDQQQLDELVELVKPPPGVEEMLQEEENVRGFARSVTLTVEFDDVAQRDEAKELLKVTAEREKRKAGPVLLEALKARQLSKGTTNGKGKTKPITKPTQKTARAKA